MFPFTRTNLHLLICSIVFVSASIRADDVYVSLEMGTSETKANMKSKHTHIRSDQSLTANALSDSDFSRLKLGKYLTPSFRAYSYVQISDSDDIDYKHFSSHQLSSGSSPQDIKIREKITVAKRDYELGLGSDYIYSLNERWSLSTGANIGMYASKVDFANEVKLRNIKGLRSLRENIGTNSANQGLTAGVNLGIGYDISDKWQIATGARYSLMHGNTHQFQYFGHKVDYSFKDATQYHLNASYRF